MPATVANEGTAGLRAVDRRGKLPQQIAEGDLEGETLLDQLQVLILTYSSLQSLLPNTPGVGV